MSKFPPKTILGLLPHWSMHDKRITRNKRINTSHHMTIYMDVKLVTANQSTVKPRFTTPRFTVNPDILRVFPFSRIILRKF